MEPTLAPRTGGFSTPCDGRCLPVPGSGYPFLDDLDRPEEPAVEIDPAALTDAGDVCSRQVGHLQDIGGYLHGVCDRPEAFSGVLAVFAGSYAGAVRASLRGLNGSARTSRHVGRGLAWFRDDVLDTDDEVARRMHRTGPDLRYAAPPGGPPTTSVLPPLRAGTLLGPTVPTGDGGEHQAAPQWEQRSDAAADRWRGRWDEARGLGADPGRYEAERGQRRSVGDALDLLSEPRQALADVRDQADQIGSAVRDTVEALGDARAAEAFVAGPGSGEDARDVLRDARGWWR